MGLLIAIGGGGILGLVAYSYFVWRADPNRSPSGAAPSA